MIKISGKEWMEFYKDEEVWGRGAWHEGDGIFVNDKPASEIDDLIHIDPKSIVTIDNPTIYNDEYNENGTISTSEEGMEVILKEWRRNRKYAFFSVKVRKDKVKEFKSIIKNTDGFIFE